MKRKGSHYERDLCARSGKVSVKKPWIDVRRKPSFEKYCLNGKESIHTSL